MKRILSISLLVSMLTGLAFSQSSVNVCKGPATPEGIIFEDDFEGAGDLAKWTNVQVTGNPSISTSIFHGGAKAMQIYYAIPTGYGLTQDLNRWANKVLPDYYDHLFIQGWLYLKTPEAGGTRETEHPQRKLIWFGAPNDATWTGGLTLDTSAGNPGAVYPRVFQQGAACGISSQSLTISAETGWWDTWKRVEIEVILNTPNSLDGVMKLWVDGNYIGQKTNVNYRGSCTSSIDHVSFGRQLNVYNNTVGDEYRYWDDVKVSTTYIGP